jgi:hypothetical protein
MGMLTVEGIYKDGKVELVEQPTGIGAAARVLVTFLSANEPSDQSKVTADAATASREERRRCAFAQMEQGLHLGGSPYPKRGEIYDCFDR